MDITIPSEISNLALWTTIVSFFSPIVLDLLIQSKWRPWVQSIIAFVFSAIVAIVTAFFTGAFTGTTVVTAILLAFVVTITAYQGFWSKVVPSLKSATDVTKSPNSNLRAER